MESQWLFNLLLVLSFILVIALSVWIFVISKKLKQALAFQMESESNQKKQVQVLASGSIGMGRRLVAIEKKLNISYNRAMELLEMGATVDDLVAKCGLIRAEAELIDLLFKESKRSANHRYE